MTFCHFAKRIWLLGAVFIYATSLISRGALKTSFQSSIFFEELFCTNEINS